MKLRFGAFLLLPGILLLGALWDGLHGAFVAGGVWMVVVALATATHMLVVSTRPERWTRLERDSRDCGDTSVPPALPPRTWV